MFKCKLCSFKTTQFALKVKHHVCFHRHVSKGYPCDFNSCPFVCATESGLRKHVDNLHLIRKTPGPAGTKSACPLRRYRCSLATCQKELPDLPSLLSHLSKHLNKVGSHVPCPYPKCTKVLKSSNNLRVHISRNHRGSHRIGAAAECETGVEDNHMQLAEENSPQSVHDNHLPSADDNMGEISADTVDMQECHQTASSTNSLSNADPLFVSVTQFYLKLEVQHLVPVSTVQLIAREVEQLSQSSMDITKARLTDSLAEQDLSNDQINKVISQVCKNDSYYYTELKTAHLRNETYKQLFHYVEPRQVNFFDSDDIPSDNFFHYIPVLETIKVMFKDQDFLSQYQRSLGIQPQEGLLRDFYDSSIFKNNALFSGDPASLKIILYADAFEVVNPIGPAKVKYKILALYMAFGNCSSEWRYRSENIQLVALVKEKELDRNQFYDAVISDLKILENEGVEVSSQKFVKGSVAFMPGDNLESHNLGGYTVGFSRAKYICRYCIIDRDLWLSADGIFTFAPERTIFNYNAAVTYCLNNDCLEHEGVKFNSKFNYLNHFHVTAGLPPCLGHDLFEGVIRYDLALFMKYFVKEKKWFPLNFLNNRIDMFNYSPEDRRDKPVKVPQDFSKIIGGACQVWTFVRLLPLIIGDKILDPEDPVWQAVLLLREVVLLVCAPTFLTRYLPYLQNVILDYLLSRRDLFPDTTLRPKHHYLTHYPDLIRQFGPLMKVWTLRFESKHRFAKRLAKVAGNFINITKSVSEKHELLQAYHRSGARSRNELTTFGDHLFEPGIYCPDVQVAVAAAVVAVSAPSPLTECSRIEVRGTDYRPGDVLVLAQHQHLFDIRFAIIRTILYDAAQTVFVVVQRVESDYNAQMQYYTLGENLDYQCLDLKCVGDYRPLHVYTVGTDRRVVLKHAVMPVY